MIKEQMKNGEDIEKELEERKWIAHLSQIY